MLRGAEGSGPLLVSESALQAAFTRERNRGGRHSTGDRPSRSIDVKITRRSYLGGTDGQCQYGSGAASHGVSELWEK
jgi:hypothetical protein